MQQFPPPNLRAIPPGAPFPPGDPAQPGASGARSPYAAWARTGVTLSAFALVTTLNILAANTYIYLLNIPPLSPGSTLGGLLHATGIVGTALGLLGGAVGFVVSRRAAAEAQKVARAKKAVEKADKVAGKLKDVPQHLAKSAAGQLGSASHTATAVFTLAVVGVAVVAAPVTLAPSAVQGALTGNATATYYRQATATAVSAQATLTALMRQPYSAQIPGPCDHGGAHWYTTGSNTSTQCLPDALRLVQNADPTAAPNGPVILSDEVFLWYDGATMPAAFTVSVELSGLTPGSVGGLTTHHGGSQYSYGFLLLADGTWSIAIIPDVNTTGSSTPLYSGTLAAASTYKVTVQVNGPRQIFSVNGAVIKDFTNSQYLGGTGVELSVAQSGDRSVKGQADFRSFVFTPQVSA